MHGSYEEEDTFENVCTYCMSAPGEHSEKSVPSYIPYTNS
jgi:hypothetical protein